MGMYGRWGEVVGILEGETDAAGEGGGLERMWSPLGSLPVRLPR